MMKNNYNIIIILCKLINHKVKIRSIKKTIIICGWWRVDFSIPICTVRRILPPRQSPIAPLYVMLPRVVFSVYLRTAR